MNAHRITLGAAALSAVVPHRAAAALPRMPADELRVLLAADSGDTAWVLGVTALLAIAAAAVLRRAGSRTALAVAALAGVLWLLFGYSVAFAPGTPWIGGAGALALGGLSDVRANTAVPESAFAVWQGVVAVFALALATLAVAGRARGGWLLAFAALWLLMVAAPVAHWIRADGWLAVRGVLDAGGGLSVLTVAGVSALVLTRFVGEPRLAPTDGGWAAAPLAGALVLVAGSPLTATDDAATALLTALAGAMAGALVWATAGFGLEEERLPSPFVGGLAGVAAVSAGAGAMGTVAALALGALAAGGAMALLRLLARPTLGVAVGVTLGGGAALGALLAPVLVLPAFGGPGFLPEGPGFAHTLGAQMIGVLVTALWTATATAVAGLIVSAVVPPTLTRREKEAIRPPSGSDRPADEPSV